MDNYERKPFEERLIAACKEIQLTEAGLMPKQTWEEFLEELHEEERRQEFDGNNLVGAF